MNKKYFMVLMKIGISSFLLYVLFRGIEIDAFFETVKSVNVHAIVVVAVLYILTQGISVYRWSLLLKNKIMVPYRKLFSIYFVGMFFNNFMPSIVGGDLVKGYYLYKFSNRGGASVASIFMDRYSGFTALMAITIIALTIGYPLVQGTVIPSFLFILTAVFLLGSLTLWVERLHSWALAILGKLKLFGLNEKIHSLYESIMAYKGLNRVLAKVFVLSLFVQGGGILGYYILASGIGMTVPLGYFFLLIPLTTAVAMLPISLSGLGIREGAFVFLFTRVGATQAEALTLSLLWFFIVLCINLIGGIEYIRLGAVKGKDFPV